MAAPPLIEGCGHYEGELRRQGGTTKVEGARNEPEPSEAA